MAKSEFDSLLEQLRVVCDDVENVLSVKQSEKKLKDDIRDLLRTLMEQGDLRAVPIPPMTITEMAPDTPLADVDSVIFDRTGSIILRTKKGHPIVLDVTEHPADMVIKVFNAIITPIRDEISKRRRGLEKNLETLQAVKGSLGRMERRRQARTGMV